MVSKKIAFAKLVASEEDAPETRGVCPRAKTQTEKDGMPIWRGMCVCVWVCVPGALGWLACPVRVRHNG